MNYSWATNLYDKDGDEYENCLLIFIGDNTIIKFTNTTELEKFAHSILKSLPEIREQISFS